jgi:hypothetical protein
LDTFTRQLKVEGPGAKCVKLASPVKEQLPLLHVLLVATVCQEQMPQNACHARLATLVLHQEGLKDVPKDGFHLLVTMRALKFLLAQLRLIGLLSPTAGRVSQVGLTT